MSWSSIPTRPESAVSNLLAILAKKKGRKCVECLILLVAGGGNGFNVLSLPFRLELVSKA